MSRAKTKVKAIDRVDNVRDAERSLRAFRQQGDAIPEVPTGERVVQARGGARAETFARAVGDEHGGATISASRIRIEQEPIARMRAKCLLDRGSPQMNEILFQAASTYWALWHTAGLNALRSADPSRPHVGATSPRTWGLGKVDALDRYVEASRVLFVEARIVVDAVVQDEDSLELVGERLSGYKGDQARAIAMYLLCAGLRLLAVHFGLLVADADRGYRKFSTRS